MYCIYVDNNRKLEEPVYVHKIFGKCINLLRKCLKTVLTTSRIR